MTAPFQPKSSKVLGTWLGLSLLTLAACSSPLELFYYQLPQLSQNQQQLAVNAPVLVVEPVMVANYLNTNALILQTSEVELHKTAQHQWAEALDQQLTRLLIQQLSQALPGYRVTDRAPQSPHARVLVQVEQFHGSSQGIAMVAGRFSLSTPDGMLQQQFSWQLPQPAAGYPALVNTLASGWQKVSLDISQLLRPDTLQIK
jgi:uncharacterized lipoprotein YmbA